MIEDDGDYDYSDDLDFPQSYTCDSCGGTGECPLCDGQGDGINYNCDYCGNTEACPDCMGDGYLEA
jgi:primosomal protein N'